MSSNPKDARDLLAFYVEAGADALLGEEAIDRRLAEERIGAGLDIEGQ